MTEYLNQRYGSPNIVSIEEIHGKIGIVGQTACDTWGGGGHVDIWDGQNTISATSLYPQCKTLYFWELK